MIGWEEKGKPVSRWEQMTQQCTKVIVPKQASFTCNLDKEWELSWSGLGLVGSVPIVLLQVEDRKPRCYIYSSCILDDLCHWLFLQESEILSMSGMESFIEKQTKLLEMQPSEVPDKDPQQVPKECVDNCLQDIGVVAQELNNSDPGEWQDLCFLKGSREKSIGT